MSRNKEIKTVRMYKYFIDATAKIINDEGVDNITARKIGEIAGFTGSTIYNYFDELSHLVFFASMLFLNDYTKELQVIMKNAKDPIDKYLSTWECFFRYSFKNPSIYHAIFVSDLGSNPNELLNRYYSIYHHDLTDLTDELKFIVLEHDLFKRNRPMLLEAVKKGYLKSDDVEFILGSTIYIWQGMLTTVYNNRSTNSLEEVIEETSRYMNEIVKRCLTKDYQFNRIEGVK